ncbi:MAG: response regulator, partial [Pseudobdellovibrionaceae bacterium]
DDESLVKALQTCFEKAGFDVKASQHPSEANEKMKEGKYDFIIVDCLLPQTTGVNFITKAKSTGVLTKDTKIILTSGIYTDKEFILESMHQTKAIGFLKKPLNLDEVLEIIKKNTVAEQSDVSSRKRLYQIFSKDKVSPREKRKLIESLDEVNGFDLPFIYSLLVETKSSGYLNIYAQNGAVSGITFSQGKIIAVDIDDQRTFLGEMLIQQGYILAEDLKEALRDKANNRKLGEKLIELNMMSPHALDIVLREQMNIRLSRTVQDLKIKINFVSTETDMTQPNINSDKLTEYLHDWIASKISTSWLKAHYLVLADHLLTLNQNLAHDSISLKASLVQSLPNFMSKLAEGKSIRQLSILSEYDEKALYKAIHFLLTKGILLIGEKVTYVNDEDRRNSLQQIWKEFSSKTDIDIYDDFFDGIADFSEELEGLIGPVPSEDKKEIHQLWNQIKNKAIGVYEQMNQAGMKNAAEEKQKRSEVEGAIQAAKHVEEARAALQFHRYSEALKHLNSAMQLAPEIAKLHLYMAWAKLGAIDLTKKQQALKEVEVELVQIPPDEKYDAAYMFVMGLFYKNKGEISQAKKSFEKTIAIDSSMIIAKRELSLLATNGPGKQDLLSMDLKDVINGFFKRK